MSYSGFENEEWPAGIGFAAASYRVVRNQVSHPGVEGPGPVYELGDGGEYWVAEIDTGRLAYQRRDDAEGWVGRRRGSAHAGFIPYAVRITPRAWQGIARTPLAVWNGVGAWNAAGFDWSGCANPWGAPRLTRVSHADGTADFEDFVADAVITARDPFEFTLDGQHYFCRAMETAAANGSGVLTGLAIEPRLPDLALANRVIPVRFYAPRLRIRIVPGSLREGNSNRIHYRAQFTAATPAY